MSITNTHTTNEICSDAFEHKPRLCVYLRTSKISKNQTNVNSQESKLTDAIRHFFESEDYWLNSTFYFQDELILDSDVAQSGNTLNEGLKHFLSLLGHGDYVIVQDISRLSRMDIRDDEFTYLVNTLFDSDRSVFTIGSNGEPPVHVNKEAFIEMAVLSNDYYNHILEITAYGNKVKATNKEANLSKCLELNQIGLSTKAIAMQMLKSRSQVKRYKEELRKRGKMQ